MVKLPVALVAAASLAPLLPPAASICFSGEYTEERCCNPPETGGDASCWVEPYTYSRCCPAKDWISCWSHRDTEMVPWICCHPAFGIGGNRACWTSVSLQEPQESKLLLPAIKYEQCCRPKDRRLLPVFPALHQLHGEPRFHFTYFSYMDWLARCQGEHAAFGLFEGRPVEWMGGIQYELYHWFSDLDDKIRNRDVNLRRQLDLGTPLDPGLVDLLRPLLSSQRTAAVLDIGSGPLTTLGKTVLGVPLRVVAGDPLGCMYGAMLRQLGLDPPVPITLIDAETLLTRFPESSFDLVHCRNALDHSWDPVAGIQAMLRLVRPLGAVYLLHFRNEGRSQNYSMLHSWDVDVGGPSGKDLIISSPPSMFNRSVNVRRLLRRHAVVEAAIVHRPVRVTDEVGHAQGFVEAVIRRLPGNRGR